MRRTGDDRRPHLVALLAFTLGLVLALGFGPQGIDFDPLPPPGTPWGVHLSFTDDPYTTMTITWFTHTTETPETHIEYGEQPDALDHRVHTTSWDVPEGDVVRVHSGTVTGLAPGSDLHYRVGGESGWSQVFTTHTAKQGGPHRILFFADQGVSPAARSVTADLLHLEADLVLIGGDLAYAEHESRLWDFWFEMNEPLFATTPMLPAIGNHDIAGPHGAASYLTRTNLPEPGPYYSLTYDRTHILFLDSTRRTGDAGLEPMVTFAHEDLQNANDRKDRGEIDHILVVQHHPLYSSIDRAGRHRPDDLIEWAEPLNAEYDIDLLLAGHNHHYERSFPMRDGNPTSKEPRDYDDPDGWIQVISGGAGRDLYDFLPENEIRAHTAAHQRAHHYTQIDVDGPSLGVQAVAAGIHSSLGTFDSFTLTNPTQPPESDEP